MAGLSSTLRPAPKQPLPTAFHIMTKPIGPICNMDCKYCFYLEKEQLYLSEGRKDQPSWQMPDDILESYIRQYIEQQDIPEISFAWQGGEPTLLGVRFFRKVVELQNRYADGKQILNALQTNGTLLDDEWGQFLSQNRFLVGLSIDGPEDLHDAYRVDKQGKPTFEAVVRGIEVLTKHRVDFNTLTVANRRNSLQPERVYRFLKEIGSGFMQFIPLVERVAPALSNRESEPASTELISLSLAAPPRPGDIRSPVTDWSVRAEDWGRFLITIFDIWIKSDVGKIFVQHFDVALGIWAGKRASLCVFRETCGQALAMEHNGDVYSCDHYVYPEYRLGNMRDKTLIELVQSPRQVAFGDAKQNTLPQYCRECEVRFACNGECPKHRFIKTPDGESGLNFLCAGYRSFFNHIDTPMRKMASLLRAGRAPAEIMTRTHQAGTPLTVRISGRNDPCPCGSGRKYKMCCLHKS